MYYYGVLFVLDDNENLGESFTLALQKWSWYATAILPWGGPVARLG